MILTSIFVGILITLILALSFINGYNMATAKPDQQLFLWVTTTIITLIWIFLFHNPVMACLYVITKLLGYLSALP